MIQERIVELAEYGVATGLTGPEDRCYTINRLLELFCLEEPGDAASGDDAGRGGSGPGRDSCGDARLCHGEKADTGKYDYLPRSVRH